METSTTSTTRATPPPMAQGTQFVLGATATVTFTGFYDIDLNSTSDPRDGVEVGPSDDLLIRMTFDASATGNVAGIIQAFGPAN